MTAKERFQKAVERALLLGYYPGPTAVFRFCWHKRHRAVKRTFNTDEGIWRAEVLLREGWVRKTKENTPKYEWPLYSYPREMWRRPKLYEGGL